MPDADPSCVAWETRAHHVTDTCSVPKGPTWVIPIGEHVYNTTDGTLDGVAGPPSVRLSFENNTVHLRVIAVDEFRVDLAGKLRVMGDSAFMVLSWTTITVAGEIDGSSRRTGTNTGAGAGSGGAGCQSAQDGDGDQDSGGGGGGGFKVNGGRGGNGGGGNQGGNGAASINLSTLVVGGCNGGDGGDNGATTPGGSGGGAIQLTAKESITIAGTARIHAGGMGGIGGTGKRGGGGGGSGGYVGLDAQNVLILPGALLAANGGGGGAGCDAPDTDNGAPGGDGLVSTGTVGGGEMNSCPGGVRGGSGGAKFQPTGGNGTGRGGGGGGGGGAGAGVGYVRAWAQSTNNMGDSSPTIEIVQ